MIDNRKSYLRSHTSVGILLSGVFLAALDISIAGPLLPAIGQELQMNDRQLSMVFSLFVLANLSFVPLMVRLSDRIGRRLFFSVGVVVFSLASLLTALAADPFWLLSGRVLQGIGAAGIFPIATAMAGDVFPAGKRGRVLGILGAVFGIAFMLGPPLAGILMKYLSWRWVFGIAVFPGLATAYSAIRLLPDLRQKSKPSPALGSIFRLMVFLTGFTLAFTYTDDGNYGFAIFAGVSFLVWFLLERNSHNPLVPLGFLVRRNVLVAVVLSAGTGLLQAGFVFIPRVVVEVFEVAPYQAGFMLMPAILSAALGSLLSGRMLDAYGPRVVVFAGMLLAGAGLLIFAYMKDHLVLFYVSGMIAGLGLSIRTSLNYIMLFESGQEERATGQGILTIFISMGQIAGVAILGNLLQSLQSHLTGFAVLGFTALLMAGISLRLGSGRWTNPQQGKRIE